MLVGCVPEHEQKPPVGWRLGLPEVNALLVIVEVELSGGVIPRAMKVEDNPVSNDQDDVEEVRNVQEVVRPLGKSSKHSNKQANACV